MYKPCCSNPLLLVNQYALTLLQHGALWVMDDDFCTIDPMLVNMLPLQQYLNVARKRGDNYVESCYVKYGDIVEPFFQYVPCMKCEFCRHSKQVDLINRATLESATWSCPPIAFTLTYRDTDLPCVKVGDVRCSVGELRYKDIQDFFKRLRSFWDRHCVKHDIRYLVAGEYGKRHGRCHWHVIMFNNPYQCDETQPLFYKLKDEVFNAWGKCDYNAFDFRQCRGGAAMYATKYVCKPMDLHGHFTKPMIRCSSGKRGGLGAILVDSMIEYLRDNPQLNYIEFTDRLGKYHFMYMSKSISKRVWKSPSAQVPAYLKNYYRQFIDVLSLLVSVDGMEYCDALALSNLLRPSPHVRNKFVKPKKHYCPEYWREFYVDRFRKCLLELADLLAVVHDDDNHFIEKYYLHRSMIADFDNSPNAQKLSTIREETSKLLAKCSL